MGNSLFNIANWVRPALVVIAIATFEPAAAQLKTDSLFNMEIGIRASAWQLSGNPIFLRDAAIPNYTRVGIATAYTSGNFKRPQDFKTQKALGFSATGLTRSANWLFYGSFSYGKKFDDSIKYANVARPYDGNPFITGDAVGGNWRGDILDAGLQVVLPKIQRWQTAIQLNYATEQNSRNNDPKPLNRLLNYSIQPTLAYTFNKKNTLSLSGGYSRSDETIETGYYADQNPIIYNIRGYGEFSAGPVVTSQRFTKGYGFQFGADYRYQGIGELLLAARFKYRSQDVNDGIAKPVFIGGFDENRIEGLVSYLHEGSSSGWMANARAWLTDGTGFDPIFKGINPAFYFSGIDGKLAYWRKNNKDDLFQLALYPAISYTNYTEVIAKTDWTSVMLHQDIGFSTLVHPNTRTSFSGELRLGYHFNLEREIIINRPSILSPILVSPYFQYASIDNISGTLKLSATYRAALVAYQIAGSVNMRQTRHLGNRSVSNISFNLIF